MFSEMCGENNEEWRMKQEHRVGVWRTRRNRVWVLGPIESSLVQIVQFKGRPGQCVLIFYTRSWVQSRWRDEILQVRFSLGAGEKGGEVDNMCKRTWGVSTVIWRCLPLRHWHPIQVLIWILAGEFPIQLPAYPLGKEWRLAQVLWALWGTWKKCVAPDFSLVQLWPVWQFGHMGSESMNRFLFLLLFQ